MGDTLERIAGYIDGLHIVDTHEHLPGTEADRNTHTDVLEEYLYHYMSSDLRSAGLSMAELAFARNHHKPLMERWAVIEQAWEHSRHTGYGRALDLSVRRLYGIDGVRGATLEELDAAFQKSLQPGTYQRVLKDTCRIAISLLDNVLEGSGAWDPAFFVPVVRLDDYIWPRSLQMVEACEREAGHRLRTLDDWAEACTARLEKARAEGAVAIKVGLAYQRSLAFGRPASNQAEESLSALLAARHWPDWDERPIEVAQNYQNWMMHHVLGLAARQGMPVQIHTGLLEGNGNLIANSDPTLLNPLFLEYPDVNFDLFHIGYPYQHVLSALAKMFPNVYIDMCWAHIISPTASVRALEEWLDSVPVNKIMGFGGDYCLVDGVYGHQAMARENIARALNTKVQEGVFDVDRACEIARLLLVTNPATLFGLKLS
ncbi:MAG: amidohydrolase family protein [Anaerolineae bacterium]|jgi:hypothetical protein